MADMSSPGRKHAQHSYADRVGNVGAWIWPISPQYTMPSEPRKARSPCELAPAVLTTKIFVSRSQVLTALALRRADRSAGLSVRLARRLASLPSPSGRGSGRWADGG